MKDLRLQTKRQTKKGFRAIFAKTKERKQKASTITATDIDAIEGDIPKVGIGRALTVILILHIVAIAAIYMGTQWQGVEPEASNAVITYNGDDDSTEPKVNANKKHKFSVSEPRSYQQHSRDPQVGHQAQTDTVLATTVSAPPAVIQPRVIRPKRNPNAHVNLPPVNAVRHTSYTIAAGDTIYRIAQRNNVKQQEILDCNNIVDARKIRVGMVIKVPVK